MYNHKTYRTFSKASGLLGMSALALVLYGVGSAALAQEGEPSGNGFRDGELSEILVTARRREERLQDVPQAILAFSGSQLEQANITQLTDVQRIAPGLVWQAAALGNKTVSLTLRGQRQNFPNATFDPSVIPYFAEVPNMRMMGVNASLYDLASVQVLKGPQGTLFGRNSTGGALLITPQTPTEEFGGYLKAGLGNYSSNEVEGAVNIPVSDVLQIRLAGRHTEHDGYIDVIGQDYAVDDDDTDAFRASIRFAPNDSFSNVLTFDYNQQSGSGTAYIIRSCSTAGLAHRFFQMCDDFDRQNAESFHHTTSNVDRNGTDVEAYTISNITTAELGNITLKNIIGYLNVDSFISFDIDGSSKNVLSGDDKMDIDAVTEEIQILGRAFDDALTYQVGAFFFDESGDELQQTPTLGTTSVSDFSVTNRSYSLFGQGTYQLPWVEGLAVTAGVRKTWDRRHMTNRGRTVSATVNSCRIFDADVGGTPISPCVKPVDASFNEVTYNLSLDWKINDDVLVYLATRKGYRSGGFLNSARIPSEFEAYDPETITDYELGLKAEYEIGTVPSRTNLAIYTGDYKDIQRSISVTGLVDPITNTFYTRNSIFNAAEARIRGIEIEQMFQPFELLEISLSYAYSEAEYTEFVLPDGRDFTDAPLAGAPENTASASARLEIPLSDGAGDLFVHLSAYYRSSSIAADLTGFNPTTQVLSPDAVIPSYSTVDARVEWQNALDSSFSVNAYVSNLTDKEYSGAGQDAGAIGFGVLIPGAPRTYGVQVRYDF